MSCDNDNQCTMDKGKTACDSGQKSAGNCTIAEDLLCLATQAKHELIKEKMKVVLDAKMGDKYQRIAEVAAEAMVAKFLHELEGKVACDSYKNDIKSILVG